MNEWREGIWLTVSALLVSTFFMLLSTIGTAVDEAAKIEQSNINSVELLKEYYRIGSYEDLIVEQSDVVNCIYNYRGKYDVYATNYVTSDNYNPVAYDCVWNSGTSSVWYTLENINSVLPPSAKYRALLSKDENGAVKCIQFKRLS